MGDVAKKVLVVDDTEDIRTVLSMFLRSEGYEVATAEDGIEALAVLTAEPERFGLILLDIVMPWMDGREFRERQLADQKLATIPVVVVSASYLRKPSEFNDTGWLSKPINIDKLLAIVKAHCST